MQVLRIKNAHKQVNENIHKHSGQIKVYLLSDQSL